MNNMQIELFGHINIYFAVFLKFGTCLILGYLIGSNQKRRKKPVGIRTSILILTSSCLFLVAGCLYGDPNRIMAQVVSGVGFLGAGAIFKTSNDIHGMTTATIIWCTASLGILIGLGYIFMSLIIGTALYLIMRCKN